MACLRNEPESHRDFRTIVVDVQRAFACNYAIKGHPGNRTITGILYRSMFKEISAEEQLKQ